MLEQEREQEKLVQRIRKYPDDEEFRQDLLACNEKLSETRKEIEAFKEDVFRLHEIFTRIPINTERLRKAKAHFDKGEFREADAVLKAEEIQQDVKRLKLEEQAAEDRLAAVREDLADRANEFLLKARLSLLNPLGEGEDRFTRTEQWFEKALATARTAEILHDYAFFLYEHNEFNIAEPLFREARDKYRILNPDHLEDSCSSLAMVLHNLAALHSAINEDDLALEGYEEALEVSYYLAKGKPEIFLPELAFTLNNIANLLGKQNVFDPALKKYEEALDISRSFAKVNSKAFLPDVAITLSNLAVVHCQMQNYASAQVEYEEALKIYCNLSKGDPQLFLPELAKTLSNFAGLHKKRRECKSALIRYKRALKIFQCLSESLPKAFLPCMATTLNNLAGLYSDTKKYRKAVDRFEEALKIRRSLAKAEPKAFLKDLATTLLNLSIFYIKCIPEKGKSVAYAQEAREILTPLCKKAPHLRGKLNAVEQVLAANKEKPEA